MINHHSRHNFHFIEIFGRRPSHFVGGWRGFFVCFCLFSCYVENSTGDEKLSSRFLECWVAAKGVLEELNWILKCLRCFKIFNSHVKWWRQFADQAMSKNDLIVVTIRWHHTKVVLSLLRGFQELRKQTHWERRDTEIRMEKNDFNPQKICNPFYLWKFTWL